MVSNLEQYFIERFDSLRFFFVVVDLDYAFTDIGLLCWFVSYQLMLKCWHAESSSRPDFTQILDEIHRLNHLSDEAIGVSSQIPEVQSK